MPEFRITFGSQYPREPHPRFSLADSDGWVTVVAADYEDARIFAMTVLGTAWCDLYPAGSWEQWNPAWYPNGEIARFVTAAGTGEVALAPVLRDAQGDRQ